MVIEVVEYDGKVVGTFNIPEEDIKTYGLDYCKAELKARIFNSVIGIRGGKNLVTEDFLEHDHSK